MEEPGMSMKEMFNFMKASEKRCELDTTALSEKLGRSRSYKRSL
jgi:hypothetical protein